MNLRVEPSAVDERTKYCYFFSYAFSTKFGFTGEGMCELYFRGKKINKIADIREAADILLKDHNSRDENKADIWSSVIIRNFILLREEKYNGIECGEEETSSEDDPKVLEGSQG